MGSNIWWKNVQTGPRQGPGPIVSCCASPSPVPCSGLVPSVPCWNMVQLISPLSLYGHVMGFFMGYLVNFHEKFRAVKGLMYTGRGGGANGHSIPVNQLMAHSHCMGWERDQERWVYILCYVLYTLHWDWEWDRDQWIAYPFPRSLSRAVSMNYKCD